MATHAIVTFSTCRSTSSLQLLYNYDGGGPWNFEIIPASWRSLRSLWIVLLPTLSFAWMDWDSARRSCGGNAPYRRIFKSSPPSFRFLEICRTWPSTRFSFECLAPANSYGWSSTGPRCRRSDYWSFSVAWKWMWCLEVEEGLSAQLEEVNNKMGQVGFLFNYLLFIIGINFKVSDYAKVCQGAIKN